MDDILVYGKDQHICDRRLKATLRKIQTDGIILNSKYEISRTSLEFLGHILSIDNLKLNPDKVVRVYNFTIPTNIIENQRFMRTVNQIGKFIPNWADMTKLLCALVSQKNTRIPKEQVPISVNPYWAHQGDIALKKGLMYGMHIIISQFMRQAIIDTFHSSYQRITRCQQQASQSLRWRGLSSHLKDVLETYIYLIIN